MQFATETLRVMGLASDKVLEVYEAVFCAGDTSAYATRNPAASKLASQQQNIGQAWGLGYTQWMSTR